MKKLISLCCLGFLLFHAGGCRGPRNEATTSPQYFGSRAAVDRITATISITNQPTLNGMTLTIAANNSTVRTWTNSVTIPASQILTNLTAAGSATNLYNHLTFSPPLGVAPILLANASNVVLYGQAGVNLTVTPSAGWCAVTYATQSVTTAVGVRIPGSVEAAGMRTNIASGLTDILNYQGNTGQISQASSFASQLVNLTNAQTISGAKNFTGANIMTNAQNAVGGGGSNLTSLNASQLTSGTIPDARINSNVPRLETENTYTHSNHFQGQVSFGAGVPSQVIFDPASGTYVFFRDLTPNVMTFKNSGSDVPLQTIETGGEASGGWQVLSNGVVIAKLGGNGIVTALGFSGPLATTAGGNIAGGFTSTGGWSISGGGRFYGGTNNIEAGSDISFGRYANSSLANGDNAAVLLGTNVFLEVSGPSGAFAICGLNGAPNRDGKYAMIVNQTGQNMTIKHQSGGDPTAANRIISMDGADRVSAGNCSATLIYSGAVSRWILLSFDP